MVDSKIVRQWIKKADEDYGFANCNLEDKDNRFYAQLLFHYQQAAEKYLKAWMLSLDLEFKRVHDLKNIMASIVKKDKGIGNLAEDVDFLNNFYVDTRYPAMWQAGYSRRLCEKAKGCVERVRKYVVKGVKRI